MCYSISLSWNKKKSNFFLLSRRWLIGKCASRALLFNNTFGERLRISMLRIYEEWNEKSNVVVEL